MGARSRRCGWVHDLHVRRLGIVVLTRHRRVKLCFGRVYPFSLSLRGMEVSSRGVKNDSGTGTALMVLVVDGDTDSADKVSEI